MNETKLKSQNLPRQPAGWRKRQQARPHIPQLVHERSDSDAPVVADDVLVQVATAMGFEERPPAHRRQRDALYLLAAVFRRPD